MRIRTGPAALVMMAFILLARPAAAAPPVVGQQYRWALTFRASLQGRAGAPPGVAALAGEWRSLVVAVRPESYDVRLQLSVLTIEGTRGGHVTAQNLEQAKQRLAQPFWITCNVDGALQAVHFLKEVSASDRNLLQTLATETQFVQADGSAAVWNSSERDGGGSYVAVYEQRDPAHVTKKKLRYVAAASDAGPSQALTLTIDESDVAFGLAPDGAIAAVDSVQAVRLSIAGGSGNSLTTRFETHLSGMRASREAISAATRLPAHGVEDLPVGTHQPAMAAPRSDTDAEMLAGRSTAAILAGAESGDPIAERQLAPMFRTRPQTIPLGVARLSGGAETQLMASALAEAGTDQAVRALEGVARDVSRPTAVRMSVVMATEGMRQPSLMAMRLPLDLLDDADAEVRTAAQLAGGALARAGRANHPAEADAIDAELVARLERAPTLSERKAFMAALGNSAGPRAVPVLTAALADTREDVRAAGVHGLRLIPGAPIDRILATISARDPSAVTRTAALFAISFRGPLSTMLWEAVVAAARHDSAAVVRNRALSMVREDRARPHEAVETLEWMAQNDPVEALRHQARDSLAAIRTEGGKR